MKLRTHFKEDAKSLFLLARVCGIWGCVHGVVEQLKMHFLPPPQLMSDHTTL